MILTDIRDLTQVNLPRYLIQYRKPEYVDKPQIMEYLAEQSSDRCSSKEGTRIWYIINQGEIT